MRSLEAIQVLFFKCSSLQVARVETIYRSLSTLVLAGTKIDSTLFVARRSTSEWDLGVSLALQTKMTVSFNWGMTSLKLGSQVYFPCENPKMTVPTKSS